MYILDAHFRLYIIFGILTSCQIVCRDARIERYSTILSNISGVESYSHYLYLNCYNKEIHDKSFFLQFAKTYRDTCKTKLPVESIVFIKNIEKNTWSDNDYSLTNRKNFIAIVIFSVDRGCIKELRYIEEMQREEFKYCY